MAEVPDHIWSFMTQPGASVLWKALAASVPLELVAEVCGASTVAEGSEYPALIRETENGNLRSDECRFVVSGAIRRFSTTWQATPVQFTHQKYRQPAIGLRSPMPERRIAQARTPKILVSKVALRPQAFHDAEGDHVGAYTTYVLQRTVPLGALTAVLNSSLVAFVFRVLYDALAMGGGYLRFQPPQLRRVPLPARLLEGAASEPSLSALEALASEAASIRRMRASLTSPDDLNALDRQIVALDRRIDRLVYDLYGLTDDEIALVEESVPPR